MLEPAGTPDDTILYERKQEQATIEKDTLGIPRRCRFHWRKQELHNVLIKISPINEVNQRESTRRGKKC